ncbi:MAG: type II toxin-antitoxin system VapC family toxin [Dehalococcoidia bacterium]|nr:type II toxin-antitoxin system VapC family toxin [Dehalococcoidia bacterium]
MTILLDTNVIIWAALNPGRLSGRVQHALSHPAEDRLLSPLSIYEVAQKTAVGKLDLPLPPAAFMVVSAEKLGLRFLDVSAGHLQEVDHLPWHSKDPFDRILALQALAEGIPIVSPDTIFDRYGVQRIW